MSAPEPIEHILVLAGAKLRLLEWDGAGPVLVGWPGLGRTAEYFGMLRDVVANRVIGVDPPGVGAQSEGLPNLETLSRVWPGVLGWAAEKGQPVVAVGHSWGGYLARLALRHPELGVVGAVLLDGGYVPWNQPGRPVEAEIEEGRRYMEEHRPSDRKTFVEEALAPLRIRDIPITRAVRAAVQASILDDGAGGLRLAISEAAFQSVLRTMTAIPEQCYLEAPGPILLLAVVHESGGTPPATEDELLLTGLLKEGRERFGAEKKHALVELFGVSHEVLPEAGDSVGAAIKDWLLRVVSKG